MSEPSGAEKQVGATGLRLPSLGFGIRIEDEVLMTATGYQLLTGALPRKLDDVEAWVTRARAKAH